MNVLWLSNTPAGVTDYLQYKYPGGGWISSLESHIKNIDGINLAVSFFYDEINEDKFCYDKVTYYPVKSRVSSLKEKIRTRIFNELIDSNVTALLKVIDDFKPDIIHLFGTESGLGEIITRTSIPVIVHIQGLINPYLSAWLPKGISLNTVFYNSSWKDIALNRGIYNSYKLLKKMAKREEFIIRNANFFFGRTAWDKRILKIYKDEFQYYYCNETLRPIFYNSRWSARSESNKDSLRLISTINPNIYKGIDNILETAILLNKKTNIRFQWNVYGIKEDNELVKLIEKIKGESFEKNFVFFKGPKTCIDLVTSLLKADLFIHPSHIDNSPNSVCEAMVLGLPVIAGNVGGISSIIENNVNGILYNSNDPYELAGLIIEKLQNTAELERLGNQAREDALVRHDCNEIVSQVINTYKCIINKEV